MSKPLIIVESFTKTKTISKYLDNKYIVICSLGHINNLPSNDLGIDTTLWKGTYIPTNPKIIKNIKTNVENTDTIYIASDPDMEGEAIAHHIYNSIKDIIKGKNVYRIRFHEITKKAVLEAVNNPQQINQDIVDAQESRRFVDRLVGYKLSPLLWSKFTNNILSVGRVQSVALLMCISMLDKIKKHENNVYWMLIGLYNKIEFKLYQSDNIFKTTDKELCKKLLKDICNFEDKHTITFKEKISSENPSPPYTTTSLQQDAYNKLRFSSKKTMQIAQQLYENGLITYMRTDSTNISDAFKNQIIGYVNEKYGNEYSKFRTYKNKIANAQEAHEAIRITNVATIQSGLSEDHNKLYQLIWKRTIACQMINAEYCNIDVIIPDHNSSHSSFQSFQFIHKKSLLVKKGYLIIYDVELDNINEFKEGMKNLKAKEFKCKATVDTPHSLYNEIGLIKALEKEGIGRPSTYTSIIEKLLSKQYVKKGLSPQDNIDVCHIIKTKTTGIKEVHETITIGSKQKDLLVPTELGINIIEYLKTIVPFLLDIHFTATMEDSLDKICQKEYSKKQLLDDFWNNYLLPVIKSQESILQPSNKSQSVAPIKKTSGIIKTQYGYCYYHASSNKYTNIESYLKWKEISVEGLKEKDIKFLKSLPKKLEDDKYLHIGQYGLYVKDKNKNCKLDKSKWDEYIM